MSDRTFAIRYRDLTDSDALSAVEGSPLLPGEILLPIGVVGTAAFFASVAATGGLFGADAKGLGVDGPYGWAGIGAGVVGFGGLIIGSGLLLGEIARDGDRDSAEALAGQSHVLSEGEARAAAAKYDDALKAKVARDFGVL